MLENAVIKVVFLTFYNMIQECESVFKSEIYPGLFLYFLLSDNVQSQYAEASEQKFVLFYGRI